MKEEPAFKPEEAMDPESLKLLKRAQNLAKKADQKCAQIAAGGGGLF